MRFVCERSTDWRVSGNNSFDGAQLLQDRSARVAQRPDGPGSGVRRDGDKTEGQAGEECRGSRDDQPLTP